MIYNILPFPTQGLQVPALHHLSPMRSNGTIVELDKLMIRIDRFPKWDRFFKAINNNGLLSRAWAYLKQGTSGVFAQGYPKFQPCIFATAPFALNCVEILSVVVVGNDHWGKVRTLSVHDDPPPVYQKLWLMDYGLMHRYVAEGRGEILYMAPKDHGEVYVPILSDGTPLFVNMKWLMVP